ncbi:MAG: phenylacetate--CoA ligase family protein, partial [Roseovarius sp.]|nr:phenylacetate--CoA ligase family protein [Roseovarius sp.]
MTQYFDPLETRSAEARAEALARALPDQIARAQALSGYGGALDGVEATQIIGVGDLARLPVLRKSDLGRAQGAAAPFGG